MVTGDERGMGPVSSEVKDTSQARDLPWFGRLSYDEIRHMGHAMDGSPQRNGPAGGASPGPSELSNPGSEKCSGPSTKNRVQITMGKLQTMAAGCAGESSQHSNT